MRILKSTLWILPIRQSFAAKRFRGLRDLISHTNILHFSRLTSRVYIELI